MRFLRVAISPRVLGAVVAGLTVILGVLGIPALGRSDSPVVHALLFYSETCPHCEVVRNEVLPALLDKYEDRLEIRELDIGDPRYFELLLGFEEMYHIPEDQVGIPELFVGSDYLIGDTPIAEHLEELVDRYLAQGGVEYPVLSREAQMTVDAAREGGGTPQPAPAAETSKAVAAFYLFWDSRCGPCVALKNDILPNLLSEYDTHEIAVHSYDIEHGGYDLMRAVETEFGLDVGAMPEVFIGSEALLGVDEIATRLPELLEHYLALGGVMLPVPMAPDDSATPAPPALEQVGGENSTFTSTTAVDTDWSERVNKWRWAVGVAAILCWVLAIMSVLDYANLLRGRRGMGRWRLPGLAGRWSSRAKLGTGIAFAGLGTVLLLLLL